MSNTEGESANLDVVINYPRIESQLKAERYEATQCETDEIEFDGQSWPPTDAFRYFCRRRGGRFYFMHKPERSTSGRESN